MPNNLPRILAVDFDGTLVEDHYPAIGLPNYNMVTLCKSAQAIGVKVILWTCRNNDRLDEAVAFCKELGLEFDAVNDNLEEVKALYGGNTRKVFADKYIDDKNLSSYNDTFLWAIFNHEIRADVWQ